MSNSANQSAEVAAPRFAGVKVPGGDPVASGTCTFSASTAPTVSISPEDTRERIRTAFQTCRAAESFHLAQAKEHRLEADRLANALADLGETCDVVRTKPRAEALRDYMVDHPEEQVTTKSVQADPAKYGVVSSSGRLQMNFVYGTPTARKFFIVEKGIIKLRPGITKSTPCSNKA